MVNTKGVNWKEGSTFHEDYMKAHRKPRYILKHRNVANPEYLYYMVFEWIEDMPMYIGTLYNGVFKPVDHVGI